ncbi:MAG TPA: VOC family protein [Candidatus Dormibacteraeota bacterium]|nr:VOC family protein [Candidatus Dormibacteraeota bacterium]
MLSDKPTYTTIPVSDLARGRQFYEETLGLRPAMVTEGGVMYGSGGSQFFVYPSRFRAAGHTQMSWRVPDIRAEVAELKARGITFEEYDIPGVEMVDGIAHSGPEVWTAWFKDPDSNLLGLTQIGQAQGGQLK